MIARSQLGPYSIVSAVRPHFPRVLVEISRLRVFVGWGTDIKVSQTSVECRTFSENFSPGMALALPFRTSAWFSSAVGMLTGGKKDLATWSQ